MILHVYAHEFHMFKKKMMHIIFVSWEMSIEKLTIFNSAKDQNTKVHESIAAGR